MKMKVSFDFDDTFSRPKVQKYARELIDKGLEVWIVTTRWNRKCKILERGKQYYKLHGERPWREVNETALQFGIPLRHVVFTNYDYKCTFFRDNPDFIFHLDDNPEEILMNNELGHPMKSIYVLNPKWRALCDKAITDYKNLKLL
jgi:hypothetical protein